LHVKCAAEGVLASLFIEGVSTFSFFDRLITFSSVDKIGGHWSFFGTGDAHVKQIEIVVILRYLHDRRV
jgi:hypothetical protein